MKDVTSMVCSDKLNTRGETVGTADRLSSQHFQQNLIVTTQSHPLIHPQVIKPSQFKAGVTMDRTV
jgi:hypothetical protein